MAEERTNNKDAALDETVLAAVQDVPPRWQLVVRRLENLVRGVWSTTQFPEREVSAYAEKMMLEETRRGIMLMAVLSFLVQVAAIALYQRLGIHASILYTYGLLSLLSVHVVLSARFINDTKALNLLGTLLLVITGVAIMAIAHRSGNLNSGLLSSVVLLFMVIPIAPWGLREVITVVGLIYLTVTVSATSVEGRFQSETLWTLQFLILASAVIATLVIVRNTVLRKNDIRARFDLEKTHRELELVSTRDPLTGAWNRRYLDQNFAAIAQRAKDDGNDLYLALLDVDTFKLLNDTFGHHHGDEILKRLVQELRDNMPGTAHVLRLGGDEFAVLDTTVNFEESVRQCLSHLETDPRLLKVSGSPVRVSTGFAKVAPDNTADLDKLYRTADEALYARKNARREKAKTGVWRAIPT